MRTPPGVERSARVEIAPPIRHFRVCEQQLRHGQPGFGKRRFVSLDQARLADGRRCLQLCDELRARREPKLLAAHRDRSGRDQDHRSPQVAQLQDLIGEALEATFTRPITLGDRA